MQDFSEALVKIEAKIKLAVMEVDSRLERFRPEEHGLLSKESLNDELKETRSWVN